MHKLLVILFIKKVFARINVYKLCCFYKVLKTQSPRYLFDSIPNKFFLLTVIEWNKLDLNIYNSKSLTSFKSKVLKFILPPVNTIFLCNNPKGIQLLTWLRLGLNHLQEHKFKPNFQDTLIPICNCGEDIET